MPRCRGSIIQAGKSTHLETTHYANKGGVKHKSAICASGKNTVLKF